MIHSLRACAVLCLVLVGAALADELVLKDGRYLQVEILAAEERGVAVRRIDNGGEIFIPWALLRDADRDRLMLAYGLKEEAITEPMEEGVRLLDKSGTEWFGVPETPLDGQTIPDEVVLWIDGTKQPFRKEVIRRIDRQLVPSMAAWSPKQLYDRELERRPPGESIELHVDLSRYAQSVGLPERAIFHLNEVRRLDNGYKPEWLENQLVRLEEIARNQRFSDELTRSRRKAAVQRYDEALEIVNSVLGMQELPATIRVDADALKVNLTERRWRYFRDKVRGEYFFRLEGALRKIAADPKLELREAQNQVRRNVHKEVIEEVAKRLKLDPKTEVQKMWEERVVNQPRLAFYSSGSYIILGKAPGAEERDRALQRQLMQARQEEMRRNGGNAGAGGGIPEFPKAPTPDEWWKRSDISTRSDFLLAFFAENSGQVKLLGERRGECITCSGQRTVGYAGTQGQVIRATCPRCAGHGYDKGVAFK